MVVKYITKRKLFINFLGLYKMIPRGNKSSNGIHDNRFPDKIENYGLNIFVGMNICSYIYSKT